MLRFRSYNYRAEITGRISGVRRPQAGHLESSKIPLHGQR